MTILTIQCGDRRPDTVRVFGPFDPDGEPHRWFTNDWVRCDECCDIYHYEHPDAPDDSCECRSCRERPMQQRIDEEIDRRKEGAA